MWLMRLRLSPRERTASEMPHCKTRTVFHPLNSALKMNKGVHCHRDKLQRRLAHTRGKLRSGTQHPESDVLFYMLGQIQHAVDERKCLPHCKDNKQKFNRLGDGQKKTMHNTTMGLSIEILTYTLDILLTICNHMSTNSH